MAHAAAHPVASRTLDTPLGPLTVSASPAGLTGIRFGAAPPATRPAAGRAARHLARAAAQLAAYLSGGLRAFDLALDLDGASAFDRLVYGAMLEVPYGELVAYGELAARIGRPTAARAVGGACNRNPLPVVVPCHRVVAADGTLGGYGGGLDVKRALLHLERSGQVPAGGWPPAAARSHRSTDRLSAPVVAG